MSKQGKLVCLDPGHNNRSVNRSPDATYYEWEFAQDVCDKAEKLIKNIPGLDVIKTKEADTYPTSLADRVKVAHDAGADLFLSQHSNAYGSGWTSPNGFGVYRYPGRHLALARIGHKWCKELLDMNDRGIRERNFYVLRVPRMPSILFETGFHTNREDVEKLKTQEFREKAARVLVRTACEFLNVEYVEDDNIMSAKMYRVKSGDSMYQIARAQGVPLADLVKLNPHIIDAAVIYAEHGGDIVYLEQPNNFEKEFALLNRKLIECRMNTASQEEIDTLQKKLIEREGELAASQSKLKQTQTAIQSLARNYG